MSTVSRVQVTTSAQGRLLLANGSKQLKASVVAAVAGLPFDIRTLLPPGQWAHLTCSAVVISTNNPALAGVHHPSGWLQPGGHAEIFDESIEATARREVREETGLALDDLVLFDVDAHMVSEYHRDQCHLDFRFLSILDNRRSLRSEGGRESDWIGQDQLATRPSLVRILERLREAAPTLPYPIRAKAEAACRKLLSGPRESQRLAQ